MGKGDFVVCPEPPEPFVKILVDGFGFVIGENGTKEIVRRYSFMNHNQVSVQVITYGATITSIKYPDKNGVLDDITLGFDDLEGYKSAINPHFGALIGRVANRIAHGHFKIGDTDYQLSLNCGKHHLHGGFKGFDQVNWKSEIQGDKVVMTYLSKDGEEGYPGEVLVCVLFELTLDNYFIIEMKATCSKPTPINLTHHSYFNLAGHAAGPEGLYQHVIALNADKYLPTDEDLIPTGMIKNVVNTFYDLRIGKKLGNILHKIPFGGYDQNMCIHKTDSECLSFLGRAYHPNTGRLLEVYSNQPGFQFYTCNQFPSKYKVMGKCDTEENQANTDGCAVRRCPLCGQLIIDPDFELIEEVAGEDSVKQKKEDNEPKFIGKEGLEYFKHAGFLLSTQNFPDSVHRKNFPNSILRPGENYYHIIKYKFDLYDEAPGQSEEEEIINDMETEIEEQEHEGEGQTKENEEFDDISTKIEENGR